jgi:hypothetical protein
MRTRTVSGVRAVAMAIALALCPAASAVVLFDNLSNGGNGQFLVAAESWEAQRFNSDASLNQALTAATLTLGGVSGEGPYRLSLYSDVANHPGVPLATLFNDTTLVKPPNGNVQFSGFSEALLPSTNYWIVLSVDAGQPTVTGWGVTSTLTGTGSGFQTASMVSGNFGATWSDRSAPHKMQLVTGTIVPEPAAASILLVAAAAGMLIRRRARSGG